MAEGSGWHAECYLIPESAAGSIFDAERYAVGRTPDFTFATDWLDFPDGPTALGLDTDFATFGDFFNGHIRDVSDPTKLETTFGHFLVKFKGVLRVTMDDNVDFDGRLPVWVDVAVNGHGGMRVRIGGEGFRVEFGDPADPFYWEHFFFNLPGMYPIEINYFNRYEASPNATFKRAGFEVYTLHGGGRPWPAGQNLIHAVRGAATLMPPWVIFQTPDVLPARVGDFDTDDDFDFRDFHWLQSCFTGPPDEEIGPVELGEDCEWMDFDGDKDVDLDDATRFHEVFEGP